MTSPGSNEFDLFKTLDTLTDGWCERRALKPLRYILRKYPGVLDHTDQKFELLDALKDVKGLCYHELTPEERRLVTKAHDFLDERLNTPSDTFFPKHPFSPKRS
jgi:hypothetical protein